MLPGILPLLLPGFRPQIPSGVSPGILARMAYCLVKVLFFLLLLFAASLQKQNHIVIVGKPSDSGDV